MTVKIIDKGWNNIISKMNNCDEIYSKVGYPIEKQEKHKKSGLSVLQIAAIHEFGAPNRNVPIRAHVRTAFDENLNNLQKRAGEELGAVIDGKRTPAEAIKRLGEKHTSDIKLKIKNGPFVPLSPLTIARKKSDKPLIDSGQTIQSVSHIEVI